jgi:Family of unknown function (DUF6338)
MGEFKFEGIAVLVILLPGFLAASIKQQLAVNRKQSELDKIIEALLYSFVTYVIFTALARTLPINFKVELKGETRTYSVEPPDIWRLVLLLAIPVVLGIGMSYLKNADTLGRLFRWMRVSRRTWRDSIWTDVFYNFGEAVQVELADGRSVMGWLKYFSDTPDEASLFLERAAWVGSDLKPIEIKGPGILLTSESGIRSVAFLNWTPEEPTEKPALTGIQIK